MEQVKHLFTHGFPAGTTSEDVGRMMKDPVLVFAVLSAQAMNKLTPKTLSKYEVLLCNEDTGATWHITQQPHKSLRHLKFLTFTSGGQSCLQQDTLESNFCWMEAGDGTTPYIGTKLHCQPSECLGLMLLMYNKERLAAAADIMGCPPRQVPKEACKLLYTTQQTDGRWDYNVTGYHAAKLRALLVVKAHLVPAGTVPRGCWFFKKESKELTAALKQLRLL